MSIRMFACSLFSNTPTPIPGGPVCQACYLCHTKKVFLATVLNQVVKAFLMVSVWACQSLHPEKALFLKVMHGNACALNPTVSVSCYRVKGGTSATSRVVHSLFLEQQQNLLRTMKIFQSIKMHFRIKRWVFSSALQVDISFLLDVSSLSRADEDLSIIVQASWYGSVCKK